MSLPPLVTARDKPQGEEFTEVPILKPEPKVEEVPTPNGPTEENETAMPARTASVKREFNVQQIDQPSNLAIVFVDGDETIITLSSDKKLRFLRREPTQKFIGEGGDKESAGEERATGLDTPYILVHTLGFKEDVICADFDSKSFRLFVGTGTGRIKTLTVADTWKSVQQKDVPFLIEEGSPIHYVHYDPTQNVLLAVSNKIFMLYDYKSNLKRLVSVEGDVTCVVHDNKYLRVFVGNTNNTVAVYDMSGRRLAMLGPHAGAIASVDYDIVSNRLFVGAGQSLYSWYIGAPEVETRLLHTHLAHKGGRISSIKWCSKLNRLASAATDRRTCLTDFEGNQPVTETISSIDGPDMTVLEWSIHGLLVAGSKRRVVVWTMPVEVEVGALPVVQSAPSLNVVDLFFEDLLDSIQLSSKYLLIYPTLSHPTLSSHHRLQSLVEQGKADVNARNGVNAAPLHIVGTLEGMVYLISRDADPCVRDKFGCTPLHYAAQRNAVSTSTPSTLPLLHPLLHTVPYTTQDQVELLCKLDTVDVNVTDKKGRSPVLWAVLSGAIPCLKTLLHYRADPSSAPIIKALNGTLHEKVALEIGLELVRFKGDYNAVDENTGNTVLHLAASLGLDKLVKQLIESGEANPCVKNMKEEAPSAVALTAEGHDMLVLAETQHGSSTVPVSEQLSILKAENARLRGEGLETMQFHKLCELESTLYTAISRVQARKTELTAKPT